MLSRTIWYHNKKQWYNRIFSWTNYNPIATISPCDTWWCLLIMNLESPFSQYYNDLPEKTFTFKANTGNIVTLLWLRQNNTMVLSLANNHINNAWWEWLMTTKNVLDAHNFYHVWAGITTEEAKTILTLKHNNITRCISAYSFDGNWWTYWWKPLYRNKVSLSGMLNDLTIMKNTTACDLKAMILHRGREYIMKPNQEQITQAHSLIDNWLDILIWWHAHVPWRIEQYKWKYIFYSLGNALFDQDRWMKSTQAGMDTIYDDVLQRNAVPTYISLFPELLATKSATWTILQLQNIHGARVEKWIYKELDNTTLQFINNKITIRQ